MTKEQYEKQKAGLMKVMPKDKTVQDIIFDPIDRFTLSIETGGTTRDFDYKTREYVDKRKTVKSEFEEYVRELQRQVI